MNYDALMESFFHSELQNKLEFPEELQNIYSAVVLDFLRKHPQINSGRYDLDDESIQSVAAQFYRLFPAHFYKAYYSLLCNERDRYFHGNGTCILHWPAVTMVDIGCGSGAVSAALLSMILRFQKFLIRSGHSIAAIDVKLIGMDPNQNALSVYRTIIERFSSVLSLNLIRVKTEVVDGGFPGNDTDRLLQSCQPLHRNYVIIALSNVIRPLVQLHKDGTSRYKELIGQRLRNEPAIEPEFGMPEARDIQKFIDEWKLNQLGILGIATNNRGANVSWHDQLVEVNTQIVTRLKPHIVTPYEDHEDERIGVVNPRNSFFGGRRDSAEITFNWGYLHIVHNDYARDFQWHSILSYENIKLAWARARQYTQREALVDEIEIRLFDHDTELKIRRLQKLMMMQYWEGLNTKHLVQFQSPKNEKSDRPKTIARLEEQVLAAALIQILGHNVERDRSYSYRLKVDQSEFLYEYWLDAWKEFIEETHKQAGSRTILRADIQDFYKCIIQSILIRDRIKPDLKLRGNSENLIRALIMRNCGDGHSMGIGLPQGHIASGFWADIYLGRLDRLIEEEFSENVAFLRYADDMFFGIDSSANEETTKTKLEKFVKEVGLSLSQEKTVTQSADNYLSDTELDDELERLAAERFEPIVNEHIFRPSFPYWQLYDSSRHEFVNAYSRALGTLSIFTSPSWLARKLHQNHLNGCPLHWPDVKLLQNLTDWNEEFSRHNQRWIAELNTLREELHQMCIDSFNSMNRLDSEDVGYVKARRRFRFTGYRSCILGPSPELCTVLTQEVIDHPWHMSARIVCPTLANMGRVDLLMEILNRSTSPYVRAITIGSLGKVQVDNTNTTNPNLYTLEKTIWTFLANTMATAYEKLKASEALVALNVDSKVDFDECVALIEEESDPYLVKNYILLLSKIDRTQARIYLVRFMQRCQSTVVLDAIQMVFREASMSIFDLPEPTMLLDHYSVSYPGIESDITITESSDSWNM